MLPERGRLNPDGYGPAACKTWRGSGPRAPGLMAMHRCIGTGGRRRSPNAPRRSVDRQPRCSHLRRLPPSTVRTGFHQTTPARHLTGLPKLDAPSFSHARKTLSSCRFLGNVAGMSFDRFYVNNRSRRSNRRRSGVLSPSSTFSWYATIRTRSRVDMRRTDRKTLNVCEPQDLRRATRL